MCSSVMRAISAWLEADVRTTTTSTSDPTTSSAVATSSAPGRRAMTRSQISRRRAPIGPATAMPRGASRSIICRYAHSTLPAPMKPTRTGAGCLVSAPVTRRL